MSERALSEAAMLDSLRDIRLPDHGAGGMVADVAMVIALAGLAALLIAGLLRGLSLKRRPDMATEAMAEDESEDERRLAMLHRLRRVAPERFAQVSATLYRPGGGPDLATLEAEVARLG